jgi:hypothetical protein
MIYYICQSVARSQSDYDKFEDFPPENDDPPEETGQYPKAENNEFVTGGIGGLFGKRGEDVTVRDLASMGSVGSLM